MKKFMDDKSLFLHIEALIDDGKVTVGVIRPVGCVAVATDGHNALAMLRRRPGESLMDLLQRLEAAIEKAVEQDILPTKSTRQPQGDEIFFGEMVVSR